MGTTAHRELLQGELEHRRARVRTAGRRLASRRLVAFAALGLAIVLAWSAGTAFAAGVPLSVTATVEPTVATIGDQLHYTLLLDWADGVEVAMPDIVTQLAPFEVLDITVSEPEMRDGRVLERRDLVVAAFETGELFIPTLEFGYVTAEGDSGWSASDSLAVTIESVLPEVREDQQVGPMDIKPPMDLPRSLWPFIIAVLVAAAAALAFYFLRKWWRNRRAVPEEEAVEEPPVPRISAHVIALERLASLERDDPIGRGDVPAFYVRVTEIVRLYLRDRFGVDAIDMTTSELPEAMREARIEENETLWAESYLTHADLAKFAKHVPGEERARGDFREAREFVDRTRLLGEDVDVAATREDTVGVPSEAEAAGEAGDADEAAKDEAGGVKP